MPLGVPTTGDDVNPRYCTSGWNGLSRLALRLMLPSRSSSWFVSVGAGCLVPSGGGTLCTLAGSLSRSMPTAVSGLVPITSTVGSVIVAPASEVATCAAPNPGQKATAAAARHIVARPSQRTVEPPRYETPIGGRRAPDLALFGAGVGAGPGKRSALDAAHRETGRHAAAHQVIDRDRDSLPRRLPVAVYYLVRGRMTAGLTMGGVKG